MRKRTPHSVAGRPGADPTLPDVTLILGGRERTLCFDFNAICVASKATGLNLLKSIVSELDPQALRGLLWAALLRDEPTLTIDEVGAMIRVPSIPGIRDALMQTWFASVGDGKGSAVGEAKAQTKRV